MNMLTPLGTSATERRRRSERRQTERLDARGAAIAVARGDGTASALCGDISGHGVRLSLDRPMAVGETVALRFGPDLDLVGRVAWVKGAECGIAFERAVDGPVGLPAVRRDRRRAQLVSLRHNRRFREGLSVTVVLPDSEHKAVLRWTEDDFVEISILP
ncbi:PilZ domain-containing protein [Novosphingobium sp. PS1R-30]|uniref:PilZ domain-containing protein n=1 Tax=Novosphingobium anseongense TaxID=3133436 RepID=A0ABU8RW04_9SPHN|nr:MAG: PilZ domain-containing protein [Novosphingobium sp.]